MKKGLTLFLAVCLITLSCISLADDIAVSEKEAIEYALNLQNMDQEWSYSSDTDAWTLSVVTAVTKPVIENEEGVSVCVPGSYVKGIDTNGNGSADVTAATYSQSVKGSLVIDYAAQITSTNGQVYTAATAPVILNTGAAGYGSSRSTSASAAYAAEGYINVSCGNRGKQDSYTSDTGETVYTGDAPSCLADQKAAARFVKYNILLGNLPGSVDYWVSTGGSGGGAHAVMFAATSNNPDFYDYQIEVGAVGVYKNTDGSYSTTVNINGEEVDLSDGAWGCVAYSAITSLYEADMAMAFEYTLDRDYSFSTEFQQALAGILSQEYMEYINGQNLTVQESLVGFDLDGNGALDSTIALTIEYDPEKYAETNGYGGTYLDLYLAEFTENLQWYVDNLDYAEGWTWFGTDGTALSDEEMAAMTTQEKAAAFIEGRYTKANSGRGRMMGGMPGGMGRGGNFGRQGPDSGNGGSGDTPSEDGMNGFPGNGTPPDLSGFPSDPAEIRGMEGNGDEMTTGTPEAGTTQASGSKTDSGNYSSYAEMVAAYETDIAEIAAGDAYGKNIADLYNPLHYIGADETENPVWMRIVCGASEGDISMMNSLNIQINALSAGVDATIEWQWDGGHVPGEIFGSSLPLWVDSMYGLYGDGDGPVTKADAAVQTTNGTSESASGEDLSSWVTMNEEGTVSFSLADAVSYRTKGASKAIPGFDVIDYGQEDYVFGDSDTDARHWSVWVLKALQENADILEPLFNK